MDRTFNCVNLRKAVNLGFFNTYEQYIKKPQDGDDYASSVCRCNTQKINFRGAVIVPFGDENDAKTKPADRAARRLSKSRV
ncbi:hypothetical protein CDAR_217261 [Caerostris darwini]|uniref:Uncharacterized protein n=1 Tax=Caerostris darwini TaxID=1538125 RepID=A0AAV4UUC5_9ARAC|nr:hypothetical protein CDAR_217261 [Caerostris darwini]